MRQAEVNITIVINENDSEFREDLLEEIGANLSVFFNEENIPDNILLTLKKEFPFSTEVFNKLFEGENIIGPYINVVNVTQNDYNIIDIKFNNSRALNLALSRDMETDVKTTRIGLDTVEIISKRLEDKREGSNAIYELSLSAYDLIDQYFTLKFDQKDKIWQSTSSLPPFELHNHNISLDFDLKYNYDETTRKTTIEKRPRLIIEKDNFDIYSEIDNLADRLCSYLSFYANQNIYYVSRTIEDLDHSFTKLYVNVPNSYIKPVMMGIRHLGYKDNARDYLLKINDNNLAIEYIDLKDIITRFNDSRLLTGNTKFLVLYNLLERIKTSLNKDKSNLEFKFTLPSKGKTNKYIKDKLLSISEIVEEKDEFEEQVRGHVNTIKYKSMINQFKATLFSYLPNYNFEQLKSIVNLRNEVFHGGCVDDEKMIILSNRELSKIIRQLIMKILYDERQT